MDVLLKVIKLDEKYESNIKDNMENLKNKPVGKILLYIY